MLIRMLVALAALVLMAANTEARRVALVIGQNAYPGGSSATIGLPRLDNPVPDARRMGALLGKHGFEVISCDGTTTGCINLDRTRCLKALDELEKRATGADLALIFFAGHGTATPEGNILTPTDAKVDCATGAVTHGVSVERIMPATEQARHKLVILDACRDNPLGDICPNLKGKKLSFTRIEAGAMRGLLLVTSTQFGQSALDGPPGQHSPFAAALFAALEANPTVYFDQVLNGVARATDEAAQKHSGFLQIPGRVVGGEAPADCLAGTGCVADRRMAALTVENEKLAADASGVRAILATEEKARGKA